MRRSLGSAIVLLCVGSGTLWGDSFRWSAVQFPAELRVGEGGIVRYECAFDTSAADYTIDFKPQGNGDYEADLRTQTDRIVGGKRIQTFDVLIAPKHAGTMDVRLDALIRHTTFASIENATIGRDNVKHYDFNDQKALLPEVKIQALDNSADLTGTITLEAKVDSNIVRAHEPAHLSVYVRGKGNLDHFVPYTLAIPGVKIFSEPPQSNLAPSKEGFEGEIRQEFALVSEKSFVIPAMSMEVFDTTDHTLKRLKTLPISIEISEGYDPKTLLDPPDISDTETLKRYGRYALAIMIGIVLGEAVRWAWRRIPRRRKKRFWDGAKTTKELSIVLALAGDDRYEPIMAALDSNLIGLREAKNKLDKLTQEKGVKR